MTGEPTASVPSLVAKAEALLKEITPGEWTVAPCSDRDETRDVVTGFKHLEGKCRQATWIAELNAGLDFDSDVESELERLEANAQFIAAAPQLVRDLLAQHARDQQEQVSPGVWLCETCGFKVVKAILRASDGAVGVDSRPVHDICPNDGASLRPQTWKEAASEAVTNAVFHMERAEKAESALARDQQEKEQVKKELLVSGAENVGTASDQQAAPVLRQQR